MAVGPELGLPDVQAPSAPSVPAVPSVPSAPRVDLPRVTTPTVPSVPAPSAGAVPSAGVQAPVATGATGASGVSANSTVGNAVSSIAQAAPGFGPSAEQRAGKRAARRQAARRRARERSFRSKVRRHARCFYALSDFERRVLDLRAGLRASRARSRAYVARRLKVSARSVQRSERRALKRLRNANEADGCAQASSRRTSATAVAVRTFEAAPSVAQALAFVAGATGGDEDAGAGSGDRGDVAGAKRSSDGGADGDRAGIVPPRAGATDAAPGEGLDGALIAALLALAALLMGATVARSHKRRTAEASAAAGDSDKWSGTEPTVAPAPWTRPDETPEERPASSKEAAQQREHGSPPWRQGPVQRSRSRHRG